jgi:hypothetical protein
MIIGENPTEVIRRIISPDIISEVKRTFYLPVKNPMPTGPVFGLKKEGSACAIMEYGGNRLIRPE